MAEATAYTKDGADAVFYQKPTTGIPKADLDSTVQGSLVKADSALQAAPVTSVAGKTGAVTLAKADVGLGSVDNTSDTNKPVSTAQAAAINPKYTKPGTGIPKTDLAISVQTSLTKADSALQTAPVTSVNGDTGDVVIAASTGLYGLNWPTTGFWGSPTLGSFGNSPVNTVNDPTWFPPTGMQTWVGASIYITTAGATGDTCTVTFYAADPSFMMDTNTVIAVCTFPLDTVGRKEIIFPSPITIPEQGMFAIITASTAGTSARIQRGTPTFGPYMAWQRLNPGGSGIAIGTSAQPSVPSVALRSV